MKSRDEHFLGFHVLGVTRREVYPNIAQSLGGGPWYTDEWTVDDLLLYDLIAPGGISGDPTLRTANPGWALSILRSLLGQIPPEYDGRTIPLFACPLCGAREEGAITIRVRRQGETVIWYDIGWDEAAHGTHPLERQTLVFEREVYERLLNLLLVSYREEAQLRPYEPSWLAPSGPRSWWRRRRGQAPSPLLGLHQDSFEVHAEAFPAADGGRDQAVVLYPPCGGFSVFAKDREDLAGAVSAAAEQTWGVAFEPRLIWTDQ